MFRSGFYLDPPPNMYHNFETKKALENWTTYEGCLISSRDPIEIFSEMLDKMLQMVVDKQHGSKDSKNGETTRRCYPTLLHQLRAQITYQTRNYLPKSCRPMWWHFENYPLISVPNPKSAKVLVEILWATDGTNLKVCLFSKLNFWLDYANKAHNTAYVNDWLMLAY